MATRITTLTVEYTDKPQDLGRPILLMLLDVIQNDNCDLASGSSAPKIAAKGGEKNEAIRKSDLAKINAPRRMLGS